MSSSIRNRFWPVIVSIVYGTRFALDSMAFGDLLLGVKATTSVEGVAVFLADF